MQVSDQDIAIIYTFESTIFEELSGHKNISSL